MHPGDGRLERIEHESPMQGGNRAWRRRIIAACLFLSFSSIMFFQKLGNVLFPFSSSQGDHKSSPSDELELHCTEADQKSHHYRTWRPRLMSEHRMCLSCEKLHVILKQISHTRQIRPTSAEMWPNTANFGELWAHSQLPRQLFDNVEATFRQLLGNFCREFVGNAVVAFYLLLSLCSNRPVRRRRHQNTRANSNATSANFVDTCRHGATRHR